MPLETYQRRDAIELAISRAQIQLTLDLFRMMREFYDQDGYQPTIDLVIDDLEGVMKRFDRQKT